MTTNISDYDASISFINTNMSKKHRRTINVPILSWLLEKENSCEILTNIRDERARDSKNYNITPIKLWRVLLKSSSDGDLIFTKAKGKPIFQLKHYMIIWNPCLGFSVMAYLKPADGDA